MADGGVVEVMLRGVMTPHRWRPASRPAKVAWCLRRQGKAQKTAGHEGRLGRDMAALATPAHGVALRLVTPPGSCGTHSNGTRRRGAGTAGVGKPGRYADSPVQAKETGKTPPGTDDTLNLPIMQGAQMWIGIDLHPLYGPSRAGVIRSCPSDTGFCHLRLFLPACLVLARRAHALPPRIMCRRLRRHWPMLPIDTSMPRSGSR